MGHVVMVGSPYHNGPHCQSRVGPARYLLQDLAFRPWELSSNVILEVVSKLHNTVLKERTLNDIESVAEFATHQEQVIESVIRKRLSGSGSGDVVLP